MKIKRKQLPVSGGYARTCYKSQSSTYSEGVTIDPGNIRQGASAYVMLSRLTEKKNLCLLRKFKMRDLNKPFEKRLEDAFSKMADKCTEDPNDL